ncbi:hypothetical protein ACO0M4_30860 [Streptomyces sp. RGM 3693]|uniref:hypothetical protein n=1 Tax=Streptomyces sp. RGM 3693 TaxID=3413284 RepID=UPI003D29D9DE
MLTADAMGNAVVVGAGVSGLLAAEVLTRRFAHLAVVGRDEFGLVVVGGGPGR